MLNILVGLGLVRTVFGIDFSRVTKKGKLTCWIKAFPKAVRWSVSF